MSKSALSKMECVAFMISAAAAFPLHAQTFTTVVTFNGAAGNPNLNAPLIQGTDGNLYGTTAETTETSAGSLDGGTVFKIALGGTLTTVHSFSYPVDYIYDLSYAAGGVIQGTDGNFYGTTYSGGTSVGGYGTVFQVTPEGTVATLCNFPDGVASGGASPEGGLVQANDGNFYGTTSGTVFKCTPGGTLMAVALSNFGTAGRLIQATDGNLYGLTADGGVNGDGSVFRINPASSMTTIYSFTSGEGGSTGPALVQASDGNLYGVTQSTFFKITLGGTLTTLHTFVSKTDGGLPNAGLVQATDGNFYGTTSNGVKGPTGVSTIFKITPAGVLMTLYSVSYPNGTISNAGLMQASDGKLYGTGTTSSDGVNYVGIVFSLTLPAAPLPAPSILSGGIVPVFSTSTTIQPGEWVSIYGANLASTTATWTGNFPTSLGNTTVTIDGKAAYLWFVSAGQINLQAPDDMATGTVPVVVTTPSGSATSTVTLAPFAPSFSLLDAKHVTGIIPRSDGSGAYGGGTYDIIGPTGISLGYPTVAAKSGEVVELFGVGFGPTSPVVLAGKIFSGAAATTSAVGLLINHVSVAPFFAGLSSAGLYQINFTVPGGLGTGDVPLVATVGGMQTQADVAISLQ